MHQFNEQTQKILGTECWYWKSMKESACECLRRSSTSETVLGNVSDVFRTHTYVTCTWDCASGEEGQRDGSSRSLRDSRKPRLANWLLTCLEESRRCVPLGPRPAVLEWKRLMARHYRKVRRSGHDGLATFFTWSAVSNRSHIANKNHTQLLLINFWGKNSLLLSWRTALG